MKKKSVAVGLAMVMMASVIFSGCGNAEKDSKKEAKDSAGKVGCILGVGGLGDQAFNDCLLYTSDAADEL